MRSRCILKYVNCRGSSRVALWQIRAKLSYYIVCSSRALNLAVRISGRLHVRVSQRICSWFTAFCVVHSSDSCAPESLPSEVEWARPTDWLRKKRPALAVCAIVWLLSCFALGITEMARQSIQRVDGLSTNICMCVCVVGCL